MSYLRTNYRLTGGKQDFPGLQSVFVKIRQTAQLNSNFAGAFTLSMAGFGNPAWAKVYPVSHYPTHVFIINQSVSGSMINVSMELQSLGAVFSAPTSGLTTTASFVFEILALIASR